MPTVKISKRDKNGFYWYSTTNKNGKRVRVKSRVNESKSEFALRCEEMEIAHESIQSSGQTYAELYSLWINNYIKKYCSKGDLSACEFIYNKYLKYKIAVIEVAAIKKSDIYSIVNKAIDNKTPMSTVRKIVSTISRPITWSNSELDTEYNNPAYGIAIYSKTRIRHMEKNGAIQPRKRVLSKEVLSVIFNDFKNTKYESFFHLLLLTGMRPSELVALSKNNIVGDFIKVRIAATERDGVGPLKNQSSQRSIKKTEEISYWLNRQLDIAPQNSPWLFASPTTMMPSLNVYRLALAKLCRKRNIQASPYDFRHTFGTIASVYIQPSVLKHIMGHSSFKTTSKYYITLDNETIEPVSQSLSDLSQSLNTWQNQA